MKHRIKAVREWPVSRLTPSGIFLVGTAIEFEDASVAVRRHGKVIGGYCPEQPTWDLARELLLDLYVLDDLQAGLS